MSAERRIYQVFYDVPGLGDGLGDRLARFRSRGEAEGFAAGRTHYGQPCEVQNVDGVPLELARRWGLA